MLDRAVGHPPPTRSDLAGAPLADEPVPVPLGERLGLPVLAEKPEEHLHRGPVRNTYMYEYALSRRQVD